MQFCNQLIDIARHLLPICQPFARKAQGHIGIAEAPFHQADARIDDALARATRKKMLGRIGLEDKILTLIWRVVAKTAKRKTRRTATVATR